MKLGLFVYSIRSRLPQVRHTRNFTIEWRIYRRTWPRVSWNSFRNRSYVCVLADCVVLPIRRHYYIYYIHSTIYSGQRFLLPFFVSAPETAQRIQGPLTTRVIIGPGPVAAASELRVSARPLPHHNPYIYVYLLYTEKYRTIFFIMYFFSLRRNIPIIHGCGTETETHLRLRVLIIFISSCRLIIIPSSARASTLTHTNDCNGSATARS